MINEIGNGVSKFQNRQTTRSITNKILLNKHKRLRDSKQLLNNPSSAEKEDNTYNIQIMSRMPGLQNQ